MFAGSVLLFFLLAFADEFEHLFLNKTGKDLTPFDSFQIEKILKNYHNILPLAYLNPQESLFAGLPLSDDLLAELKEEIAFLRGDGRVAAYRFGDFWLRNVVRIGPDKLRVSTKEVLTVSYLSAGDHSLIRSLPPAVFSMSYVLDHAGDSWLISRYDVMNIEAMEQLK